MLDLILHLVYVLIITRESYGLAIFPTLGQDVLLRAEVFHFAVNCDLSQDRTLALLVRFTPLDDKVHSDSLIFHIHSYLVLLLTLLCGKYRVCYTLLSNPKCDLLRQNSDKSAE